MQKQYRGGIGVRSVGGGQNGCEQRIVVIVKMQKSRGEGPVGLGRGGGGSVGAGVRMDVNQELKLL